VFTGELEGIVVRREEPGIVWITLNRPERLNAMTMPMKRDLTEILTQAQMEEEVRILVFTGASEAFCAGDDIGEDNAGAESGSHLVPRLPPGFHHAKDRALGTYNGLRTYSQALNRTLRDMDRITIAAINGVAIQSGLSLALCCDFRIAASTARVGSGTLRFGLLPDEGGHWLVLKRLGSARTLDFLLRNRILDADTACAQGLIHEVVPPDTLEDTVRALARELAGGPQVAMRMLKRAVFRATDLTFEEALEDIAARAAITDQHADAREGIAAFREKRAAKFNRWLEE